MLLTDLVVPEAVFVGLEAETPEDVIRRLAEPLLTSGRVDDGFVGAVLEREGKMPTGLPLAGAFNVALPHADPVHVIHPCMAVATLAKAVPFHHMVEPDEVVPVRLVFLLALNAPDDQIEALGQIAAVLESIEQVEDLMAADRADRLLEALGRIFVTTRNGGRQ